jgi:hypothetical protein
MRVLIDIIPAATVRPEDRLLCADNVMRTVKRVITINSAIGLAYFSAFAEPDHETMHSPEASVLRVVSVEGE